MLKWDKEERDEASQIRKIFKGHSRSSAPGQAFDFWGSIPVPRVQAPIPEVHLDAVNVSRLSTTGLLCLLLCVCFACFFLSKLTAGTPSKESSYTLNCSVRGRGISGLLRGWLFPFSISFFISAFFVVLFCFRRLRARNLILLLARTKALQILFNVLLERGESLALQARTPRPTWFPRESLTPLLTMLFFEIPAVLRLGS